MLKNQTVFSDGWSVRMRDSPSMRAIERGSVLRRMNTRSIGNRFDLIRKQAVAEFPLPRLAFVAYVVPTPAYFRSSRRSFFELEDSESASFFMISSAFFMCFSVVSIPSAKTCFRSPETCLSKTTNLFFMPACMAI